MNAIITILLVLLFFHAHHGVHCGCAPLAAFQCSKYHHGSSKNTPSCVSSSSSSQLWYSTAEDGGIISSTWLQQPTIKQQQQQQLSNTDVDEFGGTIIIDREDDDVDCISDDDNKVNGNFIIDDDWTNDSKQRRNRRIQSLEQFNKDSQQQKQQQQDVTLVQQQSSSNEKCNDGQEDISSSSQRQLILDTSTSNSIGLPYNDISQLQAIQSNAPAILLPSGPGTGKSHVLSLRIAYLLQKYVRRKQFSSNRDNNMVIDSIMMTEMNDKANVCTPDSLVILSFTNKDAKRLKDRALDCLFSNTNDHGDGDDMTQQLMRNETSRQLWAGTMHAFSLAILNKYGYSSSSSSSSPLRVLPAKEMRNRVSASLRSLLNGGNGGEKKSTTTTRMIQSRHLQALNDVGQSRTILYQNIVRCIELWKEANIPLAHPEPLSSLIHSVENVAQEEDNMEQKREVRVRKACLELAMRLGIPKSSALLALDIFGDYQARHTAAGTADPSDLAAMAYRLLVDQPKTLHLLRAKLKHIIVDEYQDMSVSQHALLRLVVRGITNEDEGSILTRSLRKKRNAERRRRRKLPILLEPSDHNKRRFKSSRPTNTIAHRRDTLSVPNIFCAGDASQSIYGWRGGAPELTVHGFRRDYPQGVIAPLSTCYRLPNDIVDAAAMLLPKGGFEDGGIDFWDNIEGSDSYAVSPAAAAKVASSITGLPTLAVNSTDSRISEEHNVRLGNRLLLSKAMQKLDSTILIHGLWDAREEAKYIASTIRRRSNERRRALISALSDIDDDVVQSPMEKEFQDLTDVVIMARTSMKLHLIKEALTNAGVPFVTTDNATRMKEEEDTLSWLSQKRSKDVETLPMKPVIVATMHRSKGEEYDDVYLAGWTEGEFPHPDAVSSNRVHEERRLAYVALTRARQRVVITHSFMTRVLHYGKDGRKRYVTGQVEPSRFLYELVPSKRIEDGAVDSSNKDGSDELSWLPPPSDNKGTVWDRSAGVKEFVAGRNLPQHFQKAYKKPEGYVADRSELHRAHHTKITSNSDTQPPRPKQRGISEKTPLEIVADGLRDIVALRMKGASKKYSPIFKEILASFFHIRRGKALVFAAGAKSKQTQNESVDALVKASPDELTKRPLAKCTATQLGHYLAYLVLTEKEDSNGGTKAGAITSWANFTVKKLKPELKKRGLTVSGTKAELVKRLEDYDQHCDR